MGTESLQFPRTKKVNSRKDEYKKVCGLPGFYVVPIVSPVDKINIRVQTFKMKEDILFDRDTGI
jgi:hypothetical protein